LALLAAALAGCVGTPPRELPRSSQEAIPDDRSRALEIVRLADSLRGVPYRYGGATPAGFDCSGLVFYTYHESGLRVPRTARAQFEAASRVDIRDLRPGDLVFFELDGRHVDHVGIYAGKGRFIHAPRTGRNVEDGFLQNDYYADRFAGAGRIWPAPPGARAP